MDQQPQQEPASQPEKFKKIYKTWWFLVLVLIIVAVLIMYFTVIRTTEVRGADFKCGNGYKCTNPDNGYIYYVLMGDVVDCGFDQSRDYGGLVCYDGYKIYDTLGIRLNYFDNEEFANFYERMSCTHNNACSNYSNTN